MEEETTVATKAARYVPNPNIKLVLNGGKDILDSATIPVEWHFSRELIEKKPRYIVICDHEFEIEQYLDGFNRNLGHRYVFAVSNLAGYIQLHRPGRHHFVVYVLYGDASVAKSRANDLLAKEERDRYDIHLKVSDLLNHEREDQAVTAVEFEVPEELFAKRAETPFGRFAWAWVNRWFKYAPVDQCEYRKRKWLAFTLQPPLFLLGHLFSGVFGTLYTLVGSFILLFFGYRPIPFWSNIWGAWADPLNDFEMNLSRFGRDKWRMWSGERYYGPVIKKIPLWAIPSVVLLWAVCGALGVLIFSTILPVVSAIVAFVVFVFVVALLARYFKARARDERQIQRKRELAAREAEQWELERKTQEEAKSAFLRAYAALDNIPDKVDLARVRKVVDPVTRFRLSFWGLKAKVCRPFAK